MSIRERVLSDRGFSNTPGESMPSEQMISALKGKVEQLTKALADSNGTHEARRDTERIALVDQVSDLKKKIHAMSKEAEGYKKEIAKQLGTIQQMQKEAESEDKGKKWRA